MEAPKLILVPTDFSESASQALRYASELGAAFHAHLLVIHADPFLPPTDFTISAAGVFDFAQQELVELALERLQAHAEMNIAPSVPFDLRVVVGQPLGAILDQIRSSGANLVVMGTHGRSGVRRLLLGSVTEAVMRAAPVPVIAVNHGARCPGSVERILVPVPLTPASRAALRYAASALAPAAQIVALASIDSLDAHMGAHELNRIRMSLPPDLSPRCEVKLAAGQGQAEDVVETALRMDCDLIAVGMPGGRTAGDTLRGSAAERIVQQSHCPVVAVNDRAVTSGIEPDAELVRVPR